MGLLRDIQLPPEAARSLSGQVEPGGVLTIGNFDGVHIGHQEILRLAQDIAKRQGTGPVVMTFEPDPEVLLHPDMPPAVLTPLDMKLGLISHLISGTVVVLREPREVLAMDPWAFLESFVMAYLRPSVIVEGQDWRFGTGRRGDLRTLQAAGEGLGFTVRVVPARQITLPSGQLVRVSSTLVRRLLQSGQVQQAMAALGRPFRLCGIIRPGRAMGRRLGYPTINIQVPDQVIPAEGVYAGRVLLGADRRDLLAQANALPAVISIGRAVTFGPDYPVVVEAHVLAGLERTCAPNWMGVDFVEYLRPQHRFATAEALSQQIAADCAKARQVLEIG